MRRYENTFLRPVMLKTSPIALRSKKGVGAPVMGVDGQVYM